MVHPQNVRLQNVRLQNVCLQKLRLQNSCLQNVCSQNVCLPNVHLLVTNVRFTKRPVYKKSGLQNVRLPNVCLQNVHRGKKKVTKSVFSFRNTKFALVFKVESVTNLLITLKNQ